MTLTWLNRTISITLGLVLFMAAGLKLYGLNVSAVPRVGWFLTPWVQMVVVEWEIVLGLWLMSGSYRVGAWVAAVGTFLTFTVISGYFGWIGQATCGCFGTVKASPWHAFAADVLALVTLAFGRPKLHRSGITPRSELLPFRSSGAGLVAGSVVILTAVLAVATWACGSLEAAVARLRGESLSVHPGYVDFGQGEPGQVLEATVEVRNRAGDSVRLIGGTSDCSCVTTKSLPASVAAGGAETFTIQLKVPRSEGGAMTRTAELWTDCDQQRTIRLLVGCRVR